LKNIIILFLAVAFIVTGCGNNGQADLSQDTKNAEVEKTDNVGNADNTSSTSMSEVETEPKEYIFEINGVSIPMHAEAAPILDALGGSKDYFEAEACAFPGLEKIYTFSGYDLYTYEQDGVDYIAAVVMTDDTVTTTEGVSLFANSDDVFQTYGDDYTKNLVSYTYEVGRSQLVFLIEDDEITSIEYLGTVD
jgi:predicted small lipoprotein YifL